MWADVGSLSLVCYPALQVLSILYVRTFEYLAPAWRLVGASTHQSRQGSLVLLADIFNWSHVLFRLGAGWSDAVHRDPLTEVRQLDPPPPRQEGEDSNQGPEAAARNKMRKSVSRRLPGKHRVNGKRLRSLQLCCIRCKHYVRWRYLSWMKVVSFCRIIRNFKHSKTQQAITRDQCCHLQLIQPHSFYLSWL